MDTVAVIVATFGDIEWKLKALERAVPSAEKQRPDELVIWHDKTLAAARNLAAETTSSHWLCFLDADDELEPGYLTALLNGYGDLRAPAVRFVTAGAPPPAPELLDRRNIDHMNPCVIGTLIRRDLFHDIGGFWKERAWEDWSLFRRAHLAGAAIVHHPDAVYRVNVNPDGRNSTIANRHTLHRDILRSHAAWHRARRNHP